MKRSLLSLLLLAGAMSACATIRTQSAPRASVWVCHGGRNPRWQRVSASAADAHRRHGDRVSDTPRQKGERCGS